MIAQIDEKAAFAIIEQRTEFVGLLKKYAGKEVEINIKESSDFNFNLEKAIELQNKFAEMTNENEKKWTNEDFSVLRSKMSTAYYHLIDEFAIAKSNEKTALIEKEICLETLKEQFVNDNTPSVATTKAKASEKYKKSCEAYLACYKIRALLELHLKSLDTSMNAISGIQKHDVNRLKF